MNNEPVAWIPKGMTLAKPKDLTDCIPLYTHPVKELTDADIQEISHRYHYTYNPDYIGFARAILKKAKNG